MKKALFFILFILYVSNMFSQESTNLILQYYGYKDNPYKESFIANNLPTEATQEDIQKLTAYYFQHEKEILSKYDHESYAFYLEALDKTREKNRETMAVGLDIVANAAAQGMAAYNQKKAIEEQEEAIKKEQQRTELAARQAQNKQKYAEFQAMTNRSVNTSNYQSTTSGNASQGSYNDLLTSDPNWNTQVQMWVQQYGVEKTREIVNQQRSQQRQMEATTGGYGGHIISATTADRRAIKIQVRDKIVGGRIVAYSLGGDIGGKQQWRGTNGIIQTCKSTYEFQYTANIDGMQIYFDM